MAKTNNPFVFNPTVLDQDSHEKRQIIKQLPSVHQTETLQKFFGASANHLFDPGRGKSINGYVGQKPLWYDPDQDYYFEEANSDRTFYQLEPSMVSKSTEGELTDLLPYADLINQLRFQGALTNNHNRLFSQNYYTWCPPIDLDKIVNFRQYVWLPFGDPVINHETSGFISIVGPTSTHLGDGKTKTFGLPGYHAGDDTDLQKFFDVSIVDQTLITCRVDNVIKPFTYSSATKKITFTDMPAFDAEISISVYSDFENTVVGLKINDPKALSGVKLSSGMRVKILQDRNPDLAPSKIFIVENVGQAIELIEETNQGASLAPDYLVMGRGTANRNEWSTGNRWFHTSTLPELMDSDYVLAHRATRPIIEFQKDLELFNYGTSRRLDVDFVLENIEDVNAHLNQSPTSTVMNGYQIATRPNNKININAINPLTGQVYGDRESVRIMIRNTVNDLLNDKIFVLVNQNNLLKLILETDGNNPTGDADFGEVFKVLLGSRAGLNLFWNGTKWVDSQIKQQVNQTPQFQLYDLNGTVLNDPDVYPGSTFQGSQLFGYKVDTTGSRISDPVLGVPLVHDNKGQILFENYLSSLEYSYVVAGRSVKITGSYFSNLSGLLTNDWYKGPNPTNQFMVDRYVSDGRTKLFKFSQQATELKVTRGRVNDSKSFERYTLVEDQDFVRVGREIMITDIKIGDIIEIKSHSPFNPPADATGEYEVPLNLQANPDNEEVSQLTKGDFYDHFSEIMRKQAGFQGAEYSANNYRDTARSPNLGTHIIQHSAGLLKAMLLASNQQLDITGAIRFSESEYSRFKEKFQQKIISFIANGRLSAADAYDVWINLALDEINKGKNKTFAFYLSGMAQNDQNRLPTFIPATPSFISVYPLFEPEMVSQEVATTEGNITVWFVRGHDGSLVQMQDGTLAAVCLALEQRIFDSVPSKIRERSRPVVDWQASYGDQYRLGEYSYDEYLQILRPAFERWCVAFRQDYKANTDVDLHNPWSWNWSSNGLPGHWRGIYEKFYGTQRPDLTPWESLGFTIKPSWWEGRYGPAPYTSENLVLWDDISKGYIHVGSRHGINKEWARPGILANLPVDARGRLRHPGPRDLVALVEPDNNLHFLGKMSEDEYINWEYDNDYGVLGSGICSYVPLPQERKAQWNWGDLSPVELTWRRSSSFTFAIATVSYLMKPAAFVDIGWNTQDLDLFFKGLPTEQYLNQDTKGRSRHRDLQVHGEVLEDLTQVSKVGIQQWISDLLISRNTSVNTALAQRVRGLGVQLSYKVAGFTDASTLVAVSDAFGRIPSEDVNVSLYRSPSIREEVYSGVAIAWTGLGYEVYGYNSIDPHFNVIKGDSNGTKLSVGNGVNSNPVQGWKASTYYTINFTIRYSDKFYKAAKTHTSASFFEPEYWVEVARPLYADSSRLSWNLDAAQGAFVEQVSYGTVLEKPQDVADFLNGYDRYLKSRGWIFDIVSDDDVIKDWQSALGYFIVWSGSTDRVVGDFVTISPCSNLIKFSTDHGTIQPVEKIVNGLYAIVDQNGQPIDDRKTKVVRNDGNISVSCDTNQSGIFGLRLYVSEVEQVLVFNNQTIFGDTIYSPLLNIKQPRLRIQGFKTVGWKGRIDAPGFIVTGDTLTPNFERAADDFRRFFETESMENKKLQDRARANFGYEEREYLNNLLLTPTNQFEFYQGMIQQKGSPTSMRRLLRSNFVRHNKGLKLFEEWAFRVGDYGGQEVTPQLDIQIRQSEFKHNPQLISFEQAEQGSTVGDTYGIIKVTDFVKDGTLQQFDARWHWRPDLSKITWPLLDLDTKDRLPSAGYVKLDEVRFTVPTLQDFSTLVNDQEQLNEPVVHGDRVWVYGIGESSLDDWMTYRFNNTGYRINNVIAPRFEDQGTVVVLDKALNLGGSAGYYLNQQNILENLVVTDLDHSDLNTRETFAPKFFGTVSRTLVWSGSNYESFLSLLGQPGMVIDSMKINVLEAYAGGSTLSVGHENNEEFFVQSTLGGKNVNLTLPGVYDFTFNLPVSGIGGQFVTAQVYNTGTSGRVTIEVSYHYTKGFELLSISEDGLGIVSNNQDGGTASIFTWVATRYPTLASVPLTAGLWNNGDVVEIDNHNGNWAVFRYNNGFDSNNPLRVQNRKINSDLLTSAAIFNSKENKLKLVLQLYDPAKGYIPGIADRELEFKMLNDPAIYNETKNVWGKEQVGKLWWDQTAVRYLDYEIEDDHNHGINYRWKNWGRVAPGATIAIYEWVRSTVQPSNWNSYVSSKSALKIDNKPSGEVVDPLNTNFVISNEWNDETQAEEVVYYFWVLNPTVTPALMSRKLSAQQVSNIIANPSANDIPFFAVIGENQIIVGGIKQFLNEDDTVLKLKWTQDSEIVNNHHKQWMILREEDERNTINDNLWNKMRDSLVGWDATEQSVPDEKLPKAQQVGSLIRPRQSWFIADPSPSGGQRPDRAARAAFVDIMNDVLAAQPFVDQWYNWREVFDTGEEVPTADRYIATALDLADLRNLLPQSRNMVQPGECVLINNTVEAAGFWTLWKLVEINGVRSFILEDFQKWRMQEGELWNLADWYADGWSAKNFPNYRFPTYKARDAAGNLDITLLKGTLVQIDEQSPTDPRWSWDVYTATTKYQVAKAVSTMKLNDAFYNNARTELGPVQIQALLGTPPSARITPDRIQELSDVINHRDGSREIEFMLNKMKTILLTTLEKNKIFFSMVKSAFHRSNVIDWAFKTSFLYLGGYSETLRQSPVAFKDQIDNVIAYLEEVKPYHTKIREYVRRLSYGPDVADLAATDFDKPVYPDGQNNRVLNPALASDIQIMNQNRPWKDWLDNYKKDIVDLDQWDKNWNGVRRTKVKIKFDRISCGTIKGWNTSPWDPSILTYSQLGGQSRSLSQLSSLYRSGQTNGEANYYHDTAVESIEERNLLVRSGKVTTNRPGTIVTVLQDISHYMWTGSDWIKFEAVGWNQDPDMGMASRLDSYIPLPGMARSDDENLIDGCGFGGTTIQRSFRDGEWGMFEWDSTGLSEELTERTGVDMESLNGNSTAADENDPAYIKVTGNKFTQPEVDGNHPRELVQIRGIESVLINVDRNNQPYQKNFMNAKNLWENVVLQDTGLGFVSWDKTTLQLVIKGPNFVEDAQGFTPLHDPNSPSTGFIRDVVLSKGYRGQTAGKQPASGVMVINLKDQKVIPAGLMGNSVRVAIVHPSDPSKRVLGTLTNTKGLEAQWNGTIEVKIDENSPSIGQNKSWNIIPVDLFNEPGVIWVGDARFTYTEVVKGASDYVLKNARLSASSLSSIAIDNDQADFQVISGPVFDGSKHRRS